MLILKNRRLKRFTLIKNLEPHMTNKQPKQIVRLLGLSFDT
jgi:hypothetical protein